jgi:hypothetical protein
VNIAWSTFPIVVGSSLIAATLLVTFFSIAVRVNDSDALWRRALAIGLWALCGAIVLFGIYLIVPFFHQ